MSFTRIFLAAFAVWALAICAKVYFFSGVKPYRKKWMPVLLVFLVVCALSELIQWKYTGFKMLVQLYFFGIAILLLYGEYGTDAKAYRQMLLATAKGLGVLISITMVASIAMFVTLFSGTTMLRSGVELHFGFYENRLVGVFSSPNVGGTFALIGIWSALLVWELEQDAKWKKVWRVVSALEIIFACTYISLALSRGTYVSVYLFLVAYCLLHTPFKKESSMKLPKRVPIRILATVLVCVVAAGSFSVLHTISCKIMEISYQNKLEQNGGVDATTDEIFKNAQLGFDGRTEAGREDIDISNKRFDIWETHISFLKGRDLVFGIGHPMNYFRVHNMSAEEGKNWTVEWANGNMHNGYFQILVNCGIVAFALMLAFLAICVVQCLRFVIGLGKKKIDDQSAAGQIFSLCLPLVAAILANNVMEANFAMMGASFFQATFWFAAGACMQAVGEGLPKKNGVSEQ